MRYLALVVVIASVLSACGTKGALYLPPPESKTDTETQQKGR